MAAVESVLFVSLCTCLCLPSHVPVKLLYCMFPRCLQPCWMKEALVEDEAQMQAACSESVCRDLSLWGQGHQEVSFHEGGRCTVQEDAHHHV